MKKKIFTLLTLLATVCSGAWADGTTTVTYDFTTLSARTLAKSGTKAFKGASTEVYYASNLSEFSTRFAFQFAGTFSIDGNGLYAQRTKGDHLGIVGLAAGDVVTVNFSAGDIMLRGAQPTWAGITTDWTNLPTGTAVTASVAGNMLMQLKNSCKVTSITIQTSKAETMTAPSITSEANGSARSVTITAGASNLLAPVTTYYTTDGTTPTASSTKYTGAFDVTETCTIKAITISNSSAATASTVASETINLDAVDTPTASITAVDGINRTVTFACATDGATLSYSTDGGANYTEGTSLVISENTSIIVKATKNAVEAVSEALEFEAGTAITLNTPTWTKTAYDSGTGKSTVTLSSDQSDKLLTPTATIYYSIDGGDATAYSSAIEVADGAVLTYYATADGYTNSEEGSVTATAPFSGSNVWSETYTSASDYGITLGDQVGETGLYYMVANEATISDYLTTYNSNINPYFLYRDGGIYSGNGRTYVIQGLKAGWYVVITTASGLESATITAGSNLSADTWNTLNNTWCYNVSADGTASFSINRYCYVKSITVKANSVSKTMTSAGWATYCSPYALDFSGEIDNLTAAYIVTGATGGVLTLSQITGTVAANTGILLKGTAGTITIPVAASGSTDVTANKLVGVTSETSGVDAGIFVLMNESSTVGFYKTTSAFTVGANTAYLPSDFSFGTGAREFYLLGETTGINEELRMKNEESVYYNIAGQRVAQPSKGLYIVNGKKVVVK